MSIAFVHINLAEACLVEERCAFLSVNHQVACIDRICSDASCSWWSGDASLILCVSLQEKEQAVGCQAEWGTRGPGSGVCADQSVGVLPVVHSTSVVAPVCPCSYLCDGN